MDDGEEQEFGPGDFMICSPGHDSWIVGDEACVFIDWAGRGGLHQAVERDTLVYGEAFASRAREYVLCSLLVAASRDDSCQKSGATSGMGRGALSARYTRLSSCDSRMTCLKWALLDSNQRPADYESAALTG